MIGPRVKAAVWRLSVFDPVPAIENHVLPGEQRGMNRTGPVLALRHRHSLETRWGDAVLRRDISEERANGRQSEP